MIRPDEVIALADREGVRPEEVEKEYLQFAFLHSLADSPDGLVFRGGTMLRIAHGHPRYSEDLDFVRLHSVEEAELAVEDALRHLREWGVTEKHAEPERSDRGTMIWKVELRGPFYRRTRRANRIKIELGSTNDVAMDAQRSIVLQKYADIPAFVIPTQDRRETTAEKVRGLVQRDVARDLYDIAHLIQQNLLPTPDVVERKLEWRPGDTPATIQPHTRADYDRDLEIWVPGAARLPWEEAWRIAKPYLSSLRCMKLPANVQ